MKNTLERINSKLDGAENRISDQEGDITESTQSEQQNEAKKKKEARQENLKEFITTKPMLHEMLKGLL